MRNTVRWRISDRICALCDHERHIAHIVMVGNKWFAFDATRLNAERNGCRFLGSFARRTMAMDATESETQHAFTVQYFSDALDREMVTGFPLAGSGNPVREGAAVHP